MPHDRYETTSELGVLVGRMSRIASRPYHEGFRLPLFAADPDILA